MLLSAIWPANAISLLPCTVIGESNKLMLLRSIFKDLCVDRLANRCPPALQLLLRVLLPLSWRCSRDEGLLLPGGRRAPLEGEVQPPSGASSSEAALDESKCGPLGGKYGSTLPGVLL
jgi:hypothetical protein